MTEQVTRPPTPDHIGELTNSAIKDTLPKSADQGRIRGSPEQKKNKKSVISKKIR